MGILRKYDPKSSILLSYFRTKGKKYVLRRGFCKRCRRYCTCWNKKENSTWVVIWNFWWNGKIKKKIERVGEEKTKRNLTNR